MSDISIILFKKDDRKIPNNEQLIIDKSIDNFKNTCVNPIELIIDNDGNEKQKEELQDLCKPSYLELHLFFYCLHSKRTL